MAEYRVIHTHLVSREILGELPFMSADVSWTLNSPGALTITCPLSLGDVTLKLPGQVRPLEVSLEDHATGIFLERDGVLLWGGILQNVQADVSADTLTLTAEGFMTYFRRRILWWDVTFTNEDQLTIAADLVDMAQAADFVYGSIGIDTSEFDSTISGIDRDRTYYGFERKSFGELIEELSAVDDGFDYSFEPRWSADGSEIEVYMLSTYPASGRVTQHVFDIGANVAILAYESDLSEMANTVHAIGSGDGADKIIERVSDTSQLNGNWPILETVETRSSVVQSQTLIDHANRRLKRGSAPLRNIALAIYPDTIPVVGSYQVGDVVSLRGSIGYLNVTGMYRITSMSINIDDTGAENIGINVIAWELF